jgi:hypothetical protein
MLVTNSRYLFQLSKPLTILFLVVFAVLNYLGVDLVCRTIALTEQAIAPKAWPTTRGVLTQLKLTEPTDEEPSYRIELIYSYRVDSIPYEGSTLAFGYEGNSRKWIEEPVYQKLKNLNSITVRYNPEHPQVSCLSYGYHERVCVQIVFCIIWVSLVMSFSIVALFGKRGTAVLDNLIIDPPT